MLRPEEVNRIFVDCLFKEYEMKNGKPITPPLVVEGIKIKVGFNPDAVKWNTERIEEMVDCLHSTFDEGWSFVNMCIDKDGNQWTGLHKTMEELLILGLSIGRLEYCAPRSMWDILPGGMPYIRRV